MAKPYKIKQVALEDLGPAVKVLRSSSASRAGQYHWTFVWGNSRGVTCSCEGFVHHGHCKHVDNVVLDNPVGVSNDADGLADEQEFSDTDVRSGLETNG